MDLKFISHHLISGYIPMMVALLMYYTVLIVAKKKQTLAHIIVSFIFCFYLIGILTMTGNCLWGSFSPRIVYVPFVDMISGPKDTFLNMLLFVPLGLFLPLLYGKYDRLAKIAFAGFLISLSIEIAQMFGRGATDINDLITNTVGACLGYGVYKLLRKTIPDSWMKKIQVSGVQCYYEVPIFWMSSLLLMLTVQISIFHVLFAVSKPSGEIHVW